MPPISKTKMKQNLSFLAQDIQMFKFQHEKVEHCFFHKLKKNLKLSKTIVNSWYYSHSGSLPQRLCVPFFWFPPPPSAKF